MSHAQKKSHDLRLVIEAWTISSESPSSLAAASFFLFLFTSLAHSKILKMTKNVGLPSPPKLYSLLHDIGSFPPSPSAVLSLFRPFIPSSPAVHITDLYTRRFPHPTSPRVTTASLEARTQM